MFLKYQYYCLIISLVFSFVYGTCENPKVSDVSQFSTTDATIVAQIAFISEFTLECSNGDSSALFAEINGKVTPVARISEKKYQVSWTEEVKKATRGDHIIRLFDEDGFAAVRKAQRAGENIENLKPLSVVSIYHSGAFTGPWINSEILAAGLSVLIAYIAFSTKCKLLS